MLDFMENYGGDTNRGQRQIFGLALEELELHNILFSLVLEGDIDLLKVAGVRALSEVLATHKEHRGQLTMTQCTIVNVDRKEKELSSIWRSGRKVFPCRQFEAML